MKFPRSLFYLEELNGLLYAIAGWTEVNMDTRSVEQYTPSSDSWRQLSDYPQKLHEHAGRIAVHSFLLP